MITDSCNRVIFKLHYHSCNNSLPRLKWAIPKTPIIVAKRFFGAINAQYVAAATHIRWTDNDSIASNGKHHQAPLKSTKSWIKSQHKQ